jgi:hypothetical protein
VNFEIFLENQPVFLLELKRDRDFWTRSKRRAADDQLRGCLGDLISNASLAPSLLSISNLFAMNTCPLPILHGATALLLLHYEGTID